MQPFRAFSSFGGVGQSLSSDAAVSCSSHLHHQSIQQCVAGRMVSVVVSPCSIPSTPSVGGGISQKRTFERHTL
jgi:hypothetical protein